MAKAKEACPKDYPGVTPYLCVAGAAKAIDFYKKAFGAQELFRMPMGDKVGHAELKIGGGIFMLADEFPEMGFKGPKSVGGSPVMLMFYAEDCDAVFRQAIAAGATEKRAPKDQFYGDRSGQLEDPFGHSWTIATHKEDLSPEEIGARMKQECGG